MMRTGSQTINYVTKIMTDFPLLIHLIKVAYDCKVLNDIFAYFYSHIFHGIITIIGCNMFLYLNICIAITSVSCRFTKTAVV